MSRRSRVDDLPSGGAADDLPTRPGRARADYSSRESAERIFQKGVEELNERFQIEESKMTAPILARLRGQEMRDMFLCSVRCTEKPDLDFHETQQCAQACTELFQQKLAELQSVSNRFVQQMNGCVKECSFSIQSSVQRGGPTEREVDEVLRCANECLEELDFKRQQQRLMRMFWPEQ